MSATIRLYRKTSNDTTKKPTKAQWGEVLHALALCRTRRPDLEEFVRSGGFHRLTALDPATIKDAARRRRDYTAPEFCYILTGADLGRAKTSPATISMSVRQWIEKYFVGKSGLVIGMNEFAIVIDPAE